ncbi:MAG: cyclic pyranopterin monophosphate synthase MoaC [Elusimicrobia bacterium]|nr:cyclic pyranopterin monophosphate synthase MoaC [Elusimicrobiota bacterium]
MRKAELKMIDVSGKKPTLRTAVAVGAIKVGAEIMNRIKKGNLPKGDIFAVAKIAGINACKMTSNLIPMCHNLELTHCDISFKNSKSEIEVKSVVKTFNRTGVEMEALIAVSVTLLAVYDMLKPLSKNLTILEIKLIEKTGGKSGRYERKD